jgi:anti-anti-sigma factor
VEDPYTLSAQPPVLAMAGEFDLSARDELTNAILAVVADPATDTVIVDAEHTTFIDSEALAAVIIGMNAAREAGKPFRIAGATGIVRRVLEVAGLLELIDDQHHRR